MVFCDLLSFDGKKARYAIGGTLEDMTGELVVDLAEGTFELVSPPKESTVYEPHIGSMLRKYQAKNKNEGFAKRMAWQIG